MQQQLIALIKSKLIVSAHDVSEGGLFITLLESSFVEGLGFDVVQSDANIRSDAFWFGESQSRVVVSVSAENITAFEKSISMSQIPCVKLGSVTGKDAVVGGVNWGTMISWNTDYNEAIGKHMA